MYSTEKICINIPGQGKTIIDAAVRPSDGDREIATRLAKGFPIGTVFAFSGVKWKSTSKEPPHVEEILPGQSGAPHVEQEPQSVKPPAQRAIPTTTPAQASRPQPGETWRPKDPRRIATFKVQEVTDLEVVADDGRRINLDRWSRYVRVAEA